MSTTDQAAAIRSRLRAASPGRWFVETIDAAPVAVSRQHGVAITAVVEDEHLTAGDADLIAHAPADLAWCLDRIAELESQLHARNTDPLCPAPQRAQ